MRGDYSNTFSKSREDEIVNLFESMSRPSEKVFKYFFGAAYREEAAYKEKRRKKLRDSRKDNLSKVSVGEGRNVVSLRRIGELG